MEEEEDKKRAFREAIFDVERKKGGRMGDFVSRRDRQW